MKRLFAISIILVSAILTACGDESSTNQSDSFEYGTLLDTRDNKTYKTIKIGNQEWMAENLNYADSIKTPSLKGQNKCPNDKEENCLKYGRLYSDMATMDWSECNSDSPCNFPSLPAQGICPPNWHLPTTEEWNILKKNHGENMVGFVEYPAGLYGYTSEVPKFTAFKQGTVIWTISNSHSCFNIEIKEHGISTEVVNFDDVCQKNYNEFINNIEQYKDSWLSTSMRCNKTCPKGDYYLSIRCLKD